MIHVGPALARELLDRLESEIVDPDEAAGTVPDGDQQPGGPHQAARVPVSPEPPD